MFLAFAAVRHGFFDLKVYYGAINYWVHDGGELYDFLARHPVRLHLPAVRRAGHAADGRACRGRRDRGQRARQRAGHARCVIWWLVDPIARRGGWTRWYALGLALCLAAAFEPVRETVNFGQVNMLLLFLVAVDLLLAAAGGNRWAGMGIGLATAIKLTPASSSSTCW